MLFLISHFLDFYQNISVRSIYRQLYQPFYQPRTLTETLSKAIKIGELEKKVIKGKVVYKISTKGEKFLDEIIPLEKLSEKKWDGYWRIVIFDIEEKNRLIRNLLRRKLRELGFGMWQKSVYITPHPVTEEINEFLKEKKLYPQCICLEAKKIGEEDNEILAEKVFKVSNLIKQYRKLSSEVKFTLKKINKEKINNQDIFKKIRLFIERFEDILLKDPFLPKEISLYWKEREKAQKIIRELIKYRL